MACSSPRSLGSLSNVPGSATGARARRTRSDKAREPTASQRSTYLPHCSCSRSNRVAASATDEPAASADHLEHFRGVEAENMVRELVRVRTAFEPTFVE